MARKYAVQYVERLLDGTTYHDLVDLSSALCSCPQFTVTAPDLGLPQYAFVFVETLAWFAQAICSGVWTYYEATPENHQAAMAGALRAFAPGEFAVWYERGMKDWRDRTRIRAVDDWMKENDEAANAWLRAFARAHREDILAMT